MNRLTKILTLGLEKKRAWQLPLITALLVLFGLGVNWYYNWVAVKGIRLLDMVDINDVEGVRWICRWDRDQMNEEGEVSVAYWGGNKLEAWDNSPLSLAAVKAHTEIIKILLKAGADVNAKENDGWTPLHWAAVSGRTEVAKLLLKAGAKVNVKMLGGETPLLVAAVTGNTEVAKILLAAGAEVNAKHGVDGETPLDFADTEEMEKLLRKHGATTGAELDAEAKKNKAKQGKKEE